jgi:hypothetical protein
MARAHTFGPMSRKLSSLERGRAKIIEEYKRFKDKQ